MTSACGTQRSMCTERRQRPELGRIAVVADGQQHPHRQVGHRVDRRRGRAPGSTSKLGGGGAEGDVDERLVAARATSPAAARDPDRVAEAQRAGGRGDGNSSDARRQREVRRARRGAARDGSAPTPASTRSSSSASFIRSRPQCSPTASPMPTRACGTPWRSAAATPATSVISWTTTSGPQPSDRVEHGRAARRGRAGGRTGRA